MDERCFGGGGLEGGGGGQKFANQNWLDRIFPMVNFVFSHDDHFCGGQGGLAQGLGGWLCSPVVAPIGLSPLNLLLCLGGGGGGPEEGTPPPPTAILILHLGREGGGGRIRDMAAAAAAAAPCESIIPPSEASEVANANNRPGVAKLGGGVMDCRGPLAHVSTEARPAHPMPTAVEGQRVGVGAVEAGPCLLHAVRAPGNAFMAATDCQGIRPGPQAPPPSTQHDGTNPPPAPGMHWEGGEVRPPPHPQGAQAMPSHCLPAGKCLLQWRL